MGKQTYINPLNREEKATFQVASKLLDFPNVSKKEWIEAYSSGNLSKLIVSNEGVRIEQYSGFNIDVDTRRVESDKEIIIDFAKLLNPFACISVLFGISEDHTAFSIAPHMVDNIEFSFSRQLNELAYKNPEYKNIEIAENIPFELNKEEPELLKLSPDQLLSDSAESFSKLVNVIKNNSENGRKIWPVVFCIEPLPTPSINNILTCRDGWTKHLNKTLFEVIDLIARICPDAALNGMLTEIHNICIWLFQYSEGMNLGNKDNDDRNGGPIHGTERILSMWRTWSRLYNLEKSYRDNKETFPRWNMASVSEILEVIKEPSIEILKESFKINSIDNNQKLVLKSLSEKMSLYNNPLSVAGTEIFSRVLEQAICLPDASLCKETVIVDEEDSFKSIQYCGILNVMQSKDSKLGINCYDTCKFESGITLSDIQQRIDTIDQVIGKEICIGIRNGKDVVSITELWGIARGHIHIVDRYFSKMSLKHLQKINSSINIKVLMSNDNKSDQKRVDELRIELIKDPIKNLQIKVLKCTRGNSAHPIHDRYIFSKDWGVSVSSSLNAIDSDSLWAFKINDYKLLKNKYFDFFWNQPENRLVNYGPRSFKVYKF